MAYNYLCPFSVRVDQGQTITGGSFRLIFNYDGRTTIDPTDKVITRSIPYDAKAEEVKAALEELETIQSVRVSTERCIDRDTRLITRLGRWTPLWIIPLSDDNDALNGSAVWRTRPQVRRCDDPGGAGSEDGWLAACPYGGSGGYSWHSESTTPPILS